ncbi:MAG: hypothetical protein H6806_06965 [Planctomycetes bacterium]|nr:hypothetical protein [Planctomycetota bacterium]MCB9829484.1 hypothetical protein [Planctomycetota bacterium]
MSQALPLTRPLPGASPAWRWRGAPCALVVLAALLSGARPHARAAPKPSHLVVVGEAAEPERLAEAVRGAELAARGADPAAWPGGLVVVSVAVPAEGSGRRKALDSVKKSDPVGVVALPEPDGMKDWWKASSGWKAPVVSIGGLPPDGLSQPGAWFHLGPTPEQEGIHAADLVVAPLAARRVAIVQEPTARGARLAAAFLRNLSPWVKSAGMQVWPANAGAADVADLKAREATWVYAAVSGRYARSLIEALAAGDWHPRLLFADGLHGDPALTRHADTLEGSVLLDGPDAELAGRLGERAVEALDRDGASVTATALRAYEAARRLLEARRVADSDKLKKVLEALAPEEEVVTTFGPSAFAPHGAIARWPLTMWNVEGGLVRAARPDRVPTEGCGPPLGFGRPPRPAVGERGRVGVLTYGEGDKRTIEQDLGLLGLSTGGAEPEIDAFILEEILARAARIAHQLFRREADGTPIPGWSWGMAITIGDPGEEIPTSKIWLARVAGDHPDAGGQAFGTWVAVYSTFLRRTMYQKFALVPPVSAADRPLLDGSARWGDDLTANRRADEIRCLVDGFASAVGLTLAHEYGHCCGCDHDTEHPTSIMNVLAGAGAGWEDAVWIPRHQQRLTQTLGIETSAADEDDKR